MSGLFAMGVVSWVVAAVVGLVVGAIFFWTMKVQVDYVVERRGAEWLLPALLYARLAFVAAILVTIALAVPRESVAETLLAGLIGFVVARVLISRVVKRDLPRNTHTKADDDHADDSE